MLADKLLEGYGGFYTSTMESDISIEDVCSYVQGVCIEAINAVQEAAQQYYIGDIIGQSQVIMEGAESGGKIKQLWEAFKKKIKDILTQFRTKITKATVAIRNACTTSSKKLVEKKNDLDKSTKYAAKSGFRKSIDEADSMFQETLKVTSKYIMKGQAALKSLDNVDSFIMSVIKRLYQNNGEPLYQVTAITLNIQGTTMTAQDVTEKIESLITTLTDMNGDDEPISSNEISDRMRTMDTRLSEARDQSKDIEELQKNINQKMPRATDDSTTARIQSIVQKNKSSSANDPNGHKEDAVVMAVCNDLTTMINSFGITTNQTLHILSGIIKYINHVGAYPIKVYTQQ